MKQWFVYVFKLRTETSTEINQFRNRNFSNIWNRYRFWKICVQHGKSHCRRGIYLLKQIKMKLNWNIYFERKLRTEP